MEVIFSKKMVIGLVIEDYSMGRIMGVEIDMNKFVKKEPTERIALWDWKRTEHKVWIECKCGYQTLDSKAKYCPDCGGKVIWNKNQ